MAGTYAQRKRAVVASLRRVRQLYRQADSQGERLERELDRLILRKTQVTPEQLNTMIKAFDAYVILVNNITAGITTTVQIAVQ